VCSFQDSSEHARRYQSEARLKHPSSGPGPFLSHAWRGVIPAFTTVSLHLDMLWAHVLGQSSHRCLVFLSGLSEARRRFQSEARVEAFQLFRFWSVLSHAWRCGLRKLCRSHLSPVSLQAPHVRFNRIFSRTQSSVIVSIPCAIYFCNRFSC
jgi:hypothetical protein